MGWDLGKRLREHGVVGITGTTVLFDPSGLYRRGAEFPTNQFQDMVERGLLPQGFLAFFRSPQRSALVEINEEGDCIGTDTGELVVKRREEWYWSDGGERMKQETQLANLRQLLERWLYTTAEKKLLERRIANMLRERPELAPYFSSGEVTIRGQDGRLIVEARTRKWTEQFNIDLRGGV